MDEGQGLRIDLDLVRAFERGLDPQHPERSQLPARILGYGEISTVFEVQVPGLEGLACKRLPLFRAHAEVERYQAAYEGYNRLLAAAGLRLPPHGHVTFLDDAGRPILYILQQQLPSSSIGNRAIHLLEREEVLRLVGRVLAELRKVWSWNREQAGRLQLGLDGQVSNWSIAGFDPQAPHVAEDAPLTYVDTSTPLYRVDGVEQLDAELFLRSAPSFLAWLLRLLYLKDVVNRYYDLHLVVVDLVANFYKEQRPQLVPDLVAMANSFLAHEAADLQLAPLREPEVRSYYREDATIWSLYLGARRLDRFLRTRLLRRSYPYILPGPIRR